MKKRFLFSVVLVFLFYMLSISAFAKTSDDLSAAHATPNGDKLTPYEEKLTTEERMRFTLGGELFIDKIRNPESYTLTQETKNKKNPFRITLNQESVQALGTGVIRLPIAFMRIVQEAPRPDGKKDGFILKPYVVINSSKIQLPLNQGGKKISSDIHVFWVVLEAIPAEGKYFSDEILTELWQHAMQKKEIYVSGKIVHRYLVYQTKKDLKQQNGKHTMFVALAIETLNGKELPKHSIKFPAGKFYGIIEP